MTCIKTVNDYLENIPAAMAMGTAMATAMGTAMATMTATMTAMEIAMARLRSTARGGRG